MLLLVEEQEHGISDEGFNFLQRLAQGTEFEDVQLLAAVDRCLDFLLELWDGINVHAAREHGERSTELLQWTTLLLSERHLYVDGEVYSAITARMQEACNRLRVVVSTSSQLIKINGRVSFWTAWLAPHKRRVLVQDEFQLESAEEAAASVAPFDCLVAAGDVKQAPWNEHQQISLRHPPRSEQRYTSPLQWMPAGRWAQACGALGRGLDFKPGWETLRFGQEVVDVLKALFPDHFGELRCGPGQRDTVIVPVLFENLVCEWEFAHKEVLRAEAVFAAALFCIAVEMVVAGTPEAGDKAAVLVIG